MPALALQLIPLIPGMVTSLLEIVNAIKKDDATPAETKAELDLLSVELSAMVAKVKAVQLPTGD